MGRIQAPCGGQAWRNARHTHALQRVVVLLQHAFDRILVQRPELEVTLLAQATRREVLRTDDAIGR